MIITFNKQLHNNFTLRMIDVIIPSYDDGNSSSSTMILIPVERQYMVCRQTIDINTDVIAGIRYLANNYIMLASTITLDFNNDDSSSYYHFTDSYGQYYNYANEPLSDDEEHYQFISRLINVMYMYS